MQSWYKNKDKSSINQGCPVVEKVKSVCVSIFFLLVYIWTWECHSHSLAHARMAHQCLRVCAFKSRRALSMLGPPACPGRTSVTETSVFGSARNSDNSPVNKTKPPWHKMANWCSNGYGCSWSFGYSQCKKILRWSHLKKKIQWPLLENADI